MKRKREEKETATAAGTGSSRDGGPGRGYEVMLLLLCQHDTFPFVKIPDFEKCLDIVATLQAKKGSGEALLADFEVSKGIYSRARIEDTDSVCLWLGANVMLLEYSCEEVTTLLQKNLEDAKASLEVFVTIARGYNWDVHQKIIRQAGAPAKDS
ncbi:hypothetical protein ACJRO7_020700 [Eucalyptus globulus]|uniref:Prefoldin subunit 3 n=1 Tax=Eucalyptus globulus TaxID=34317 RepID=A0ABD3KMB3_EUCGL